MGFDVAKAVLMYTDKTIDLLTKDLLALGGTRGGGVLNEMRKIHKYLRGQHGARFKAHITPDGSPWQKTLVRQKPYPQPRIGGAGPIRLKGGDLRDWRNVAYGKIKTTSQFAESVLIVSKLNAARKDDKYIPAIYRSSGLMSNKKQNIYRSSKGGATTPIPVTGKLYNMMTKDKIIGSGWANKIGLTYGLMSDASAWAHKLHYGGFWRKGRIPARPFIGMNRADVRHITEIIVAAIAKKAGKLGMGAAG